MTKMLPTATKLYRTQSREIFHCQCKIKIPVEYEEEILDSCFQIMEQVDKAYNSYQKDSYFDRMNRHAGNFVEVDDNTILLLQTLIRISDCTDGAYDITAMPLIRLWGFYSQAENRSIPSATQIMEVQKQVGYQQIEIVGNEVKIGKNQEIITGSFIKAFAVDQVVMFLKDNGISDAIINAGGSTIYGLNDESHTHWGVRIPNPSGEEQREMIQNECFSLSASIHNFLEIDGKRYGHILNARTGFPSETLQVGVRTQSAFLGDALSTAIFAIEDKNEQRIVQKLKENFEFEHYRINVPADGTD